jgi:hypothetical protein
MFRNTLNGVSSLQDHDARSNVLVAQMANMIELARIRGRPRRHEVTNDFDLVASVEAFEMHVDDKLGQPRNLDPVIALPQPADAKHGERRIAPLGNRSQLGLTWLP